MRSKVYLIMSAAVMTMLVLSLLPSGAKAASNEAIVRIECDSWYWGTIKGDEEIGVEDTGTKEYTVSGDIIYVIIYKGDSNDDELKASIIVNGAERVSDSTTEPMGELRISFSFGMLADDDDDGNGSVDGGRSDYACGSTFILPLSILGLAVFIVYTRR